MPYQASRRRFLTLVGASVGLMATSARGAQAQERGDSEPALVNGERPPWDRDSGPIAGLERAIIVALAGSELEVEVEGSGLRYRLLPQDFGDWTHQIGDRVVVVQDPAGRRSIKPFVTTVDAPLPRRPSKVEIGSVIEVGRFSARVASEGVKEAYEAIRGKAVRASAHWLLIENVHTGEYRVFGVIDRE